MAVDQEFYYARVFDNKFCCFSGSSRNYEPNLTALGIYTIDSLPSNASISYSRINQLVAKVKVYVRRTRQNGSKYLSSVFVRVSNDKLGSIVNNPQQLTFPNCVTLNKAVVVSNVRR